ncbi:MAG: hypothetical protein KatS3mg002_1195 [Candidatus Woesearchaeota archaeon]|nr:MAG: hypothetical protein KatS3mg002_1195 [Candidatus Woesearchaeota archaeon]
MSYKDRDINTRDLSEDYMRSVSESELKDRAYTPYELAQHDRESIEEIKKAIRLKKYNNKEIIKETLEYIENLANKINIAIQNEKRENKTTWELEADINELKKIFEQLNSLLLNLEDKEIDGSIKSAKKH